MSGEDDRDRPSKAPETSIDVPPPPLGPGDSNEERLGAISIPPASIAPERTEATTDGSMYIAPESFAPASVAPASYPDSIAPESFAPASYGDSLAPASMPPVSYIDSIPPPSMAPESFSGSMAPESFSGSIAPQSIAPQSIAPQSAANPSETPTTPPDAMPSPFARAAAVLASMPAAGAGETADVTALDRGPPTMEPGPLDTVDLEAPDLDEDEPAELSSLVGVIPWQDERRGQVVVLAGGKGGVGRSLLAANLGLFLSRLGRHVVLADLDPSGASLHTFLGLNPLVPALGTAYRRSAPPQIDKLQGDMRLVRASRPYFGGADDPARVEVIEAARELAEDILIVDVGTQVDALTLDVFLDADVSAVVTLSERPSIERTYAFLRQALDRRLLAVDDHPAELARALVSADERGQVDAPPDLVAGLTGVEPQAAEAIRARLIGFAPGIIFNRCRTRAERDMATGVCIALRRRWGINAEVLACVDNDDAVSEASRRRRPLVLEYPGSTVSGQIEKLARRVLSKVGVRG